MKKISILCVIALAICGKSDGLMASFLMYSGIVVHTVKLITRPFSHFFSGSDEKKPYASRAFFKEECEHLNAAQENKNCTSPHLMHWDQISPEDLNLENWLQALDAEQLQKTHEHFQEAQEFCNQDTIKGAGLCNEITLRNNLQKLLLEQFQHICNNPVVVGLELCNQENLQKALLK